MITRFISCFSCVTIGAEKLNIRGKIILDKPNPSGMTRLGNRFTKFTAVVIDVVKL